MSIPNAVLDQAIDHNNADKVISKIWEHFSTLIDLNPELANKLIIRKEAPYHICIKLQEALGEEQHVVKAEQ